MKKFSDVKLAETINLLRAARKLTEPGSVESESLLEQIEAGRREIARRCHGIQNSMKRWHAKYGA